MSIGKRCCAGAYVLGQQQLTAGRCCDLGQCDVAGPLVGNGEVVNLFDRVAEEIHAYRVLLGRRKDVQDAAAYGELTAPLDQVDTGIRRSYQGRRQVREVDLLADRESDGF